MKAFVVVATKGRPKETFTLLDYLAAQTFPIEKVIIVGSEQNDIDCLNRHPHFSEDQLVVTTSDVGLTRQRNAGLDTIKSFVGTVDPREWFVVFFDDDFRPSKNWIEMCANAFISDSRLMGVGGWVLADGVRESGISEQDAEQYIQGLKMPQPLFWSGFEKKHIVALYGCNMAYSGQFALEERFDEHLPLYGWLEDIDYSCRASKQGYLTYVPECKGVHLGVTGGRTSGVRFGYSQIANGLYLINKGSTPFKLARRLMIRNILSNIFRTITFNNKKDFRGRLYGNILAIFDILRSKCHPTRVLEI